MNCSAPSTCHSTRPPDAPLAFLSRSPKAKVSSERRSSRATVGRRSLKEVTCHGNFREPSSISSTLKPNVGGGGHAVQRPALPGHHGAVVPRRAPHGELSAGLGRCDELSLPPEFQPLFTRTTSTQPFGRPPAEHSSRGRRLSRASFHPLVGRGPEIVLTRYWFTHGVRGYFIFFMTFAQFHFTPLPWVVFPTHHSMPVLVT